MEFSYKCVRKSHSHFARLQNTSDLYLTFIISSMATSPTSKVMNTPLALRARADSLRLKPQVPDSFIESLKSPLPDSETLKQEQVLPNISKSPSSSTPAQLLPTQIWLGSYHIFLGAIAWYILSVLAILSMSLEVLRCVSSILSLVLSYLWLRYLSKEENGDEDDRKNEKKEKGNYMKRSPFLKTLSATFSYTGESSVAESTPNSSLQKKQTEKKQVTAAIPLENSFQHSSIDEIKMEAVENIGELHDVDASGADSGDKDSGEKHAKENSEGDICDVDACDNNEIRAHIKIILNDRDYSTKSQRKSEHCDLEAKIRTRCSTDATIEKLIKVLSCNEFSIYKFKVRRGRGMFRWIRRERGRSGRGFVSVKTIGLNVMLEIEESGNREDPCAVIYATVTKKWKNHLGHQRNNCGGVYEQKIEFDRLVRMLQLKMGE